MLSINQGLVNSAHATWKFVDDIESGINDILTNGGKVKSKYTFKLNEFIDNVTKNKGDYQEIIAAFGKYNTAINVPYVLMKNSHYFGQFKGLFLAGKEGFMWSHLRSEVMRMREYKFYEFSKIKKNKMKEII